MSMPHIPDFKPDIDLCKNDVVKLLLTSIALEEIGLAHIINAEGEKLQAILETKPCVSDLLEADKSVQGTLRDIIKKEMLLEFKFQDTLEYYFAKAKDKEHHTDED